MAADPCTRVCHKQPSAPHSAGLRDPAAAADHREWQENTRVIKLIALMTS